VVHTTLQFKSSFSLVEIEEEWMSILEVERNGDHVI
jgi:hypothetical protein